MMTTAAIFRCMWCARRELTCGRLPKALESVSASALISPNCAERAPAISGSRTPYRWMNLNDRLRNLLWRMSHTPTMWPRTTLSRPMRRFRTCLRGNWAPTTRAGCETASMCVSTARNPRTGRMASRCAYVPSMLVWSDVLLPLAQAGFRVIAPDLLGYGYSDKPRDHAYSIKSQARAVMGLMDRLGIARAILVGGSYGGAVAATIALDHPERVERLIFVGAVTNDRIKESLLLRLADVPLLGDILTPLFIGSRWVMRKRMEQKYRRHAAPVDEHKLTARHHLPASAGAHPANVRTVRDCSSE